MLEKGPNAPKFLDRNEYRFRELSRTCDCVYRDLHKRGIRYYCTPNTDFYKRRGGKVMDNWSTWVILLLKDYNVLYIYASVGGATRHTVVRLCVCHSVCYFSFAAYAER